MPEDKVTEGTTLAELLLEHLPARHPHVADELVRKLFELDDEGPARLDGDGSPVLSDRYLVVVNGKYYALLPGGARYKLRDGDVISVFPPLGGG